MIKCPKCGTDTPDSFQFCDECGTRLPRPAPEPPAYVPPQAATIAETSVNSTVIEPPIFTETEAVPSQVEAVAVINPPAAGEPQAMDAKLVIERGQSPGAEFRISGTECVIGRWDADNGVFPDIDLDTFDPEAKISRRHARIRNQNGEYVIEDLGSTNGTYVNRGRRLLPGMAQPINDGDEIIIGKTFLRFQITR